VITGGHHTLSGRGFDTARIDIVAAVGIETALAAIFIESIDFHDKNNCEAWQGAARSDNHGVTAV